MLTQADQSPINMRSNPHLVIGESPHVSNSNLFNMQNKQSNNTSNKNIKTLKDHTKLQRQGEMEE